MISKIVEAFSIKDTPKAMNLIMKQISKFIGKRVYFSEITEEFVNSIGKHVGIYGFLDNGDSLRLNWRIDKSGEISSVDFFSGYSNEPEYNIEMSDKGIIQILKDIKNYYTKNTVIENKKITERSAPETKSLTIKQWIIDNNLTESMLKNMTIKSLFDDYIDWYMSLDDPYNYVKFSVSAFRYELLQYLEVLNISRPTAVTRAKSENKIIDSSDSSNFNDLTNNDEINNYEELILQLEAFVQLVGNNVNSEFGNGLIVSGESGVGKSYITEQTLKTLSRKAVGAKGSIKNAKSVYKKLAEHRENKVIVFDDFDNVLKNKETVNILKAALDDKKVRKVTYIDPEFIPFNVYTKNPEKYDKKNKIPDTIYFSSSIIIITNLKKRQIDSALISRSLNIDFIITKDEMMRYIDKKMDDILKEVPKNFKIEVYDYIQTFMSKLKRIDIRQFKKAVIIRTSNHPKWKQWIKNMLISVN